MNNRKPPQDNKYKIASCIDRIWSTVFFISIIVTFFQSMYGSNNIHSFSIINAMILIILFFLEYLRTENISEATAIRRKNLFDTTFNLSRLQNRTDKFYDNHEINDKMIKLFANIQESMLYTRETSSIMFKQQCIISSVIGIFVLISIFNSGITESNFITMGIFLSYFGVGRTLDIRSVYKGSSKLFEESLRIANDMESEIKECNMAEILEVIIDYEAILSSMNFVLSENIHDRKKMLLKEEWLELKKKYRVYN